jgi:hypothetical protein
MGKLSGLSLALLLAALSAQASTLPRSKRAVASRSRAMQAAGRTSSTIVTHRPAAPVAKSAASSPSYNSGPAFTTRSSGLRGIDGAMTGKAAGSSPMVYSRPSGFRTDVAPALRDVTPTPAAPIRVDAAKAPPVAASGGVSEGPPDKAVSSGSSSNPMKGILNAFADMFGDMAKMLGGGK